MQLWNRKTLTFFRIPVYAKNFEFFKQTNKRCQTTAVDVLGNFFLTFYIWNDYLMYIFWMFLYVLQISVVHSIKPLYNVHNWWFIHLSACIRETKKKRNTCLKLWFCSSYFCTTLFKLIWFYLNSWFKIYCLTFHNIGNSWFHFRKKIRIKYAIQQFYISKV